MDYVVMVELMKSEFREYMESMELIKLMELVKGKQLMKGLISDEIDGTYKNSRVGEIFSLMELNFRNEVINGIDAMHWTNQIYGAKRITEVDCISCIDGLIVIDGIE